MIFVTVGTHEQPFDRLLRAVDDMKARGVIAEDVRMQTGWSTYEPTRCSWSPMLSWQDMQTNFDQARIIVSHGGPSTFMEAVVRGKTPIVMPRLSRYGEHVNDHQNDFVRSIARQYGGIIPVSDERELEYAISNYDRLTSATSGVASHNAEFCRRFSLLVDDLLDDAWPHGPRTPKGER